MNRTVEKQELPISVEGSSYVSRIRNLLTFSNFESKKTTFVDRAFEEVEFLYIMPS